MICFPNAKINLGLKILGQREDGYHDLETVFYPIPLADALEIVPAQANNFTQSGLHLDVDPRHNLVAKTLALFADQFNVPPLHIFLHKAIPTGAGLGGGSSDAAHMVKLLNQLIGQSLSIKEMETIASQLGADCPFFIKNQPTVATGTGNIFTPVNLDLQGYTFVIAKPDVAMNTQLAYQYVEASDNTPSPAAVVQLPVSQWKSLLINDFETVVAKIHPIVGEIKSYFYQQGATYAAMSGSGTAVFGLFEKEPLLDISIPFLRKYSF